MASSLDGIRLGSSAPQPPVPPLLPSVLPPPPPPITSIQSAENDGESREHDEDVSIPKLSRLLDQLHLDPTIPRFRGEGSHGLRADATHVHPAILRQTGAPSRHHALNASVVKRRKAFWRTQSVRILLKVALVNTDPESSGRKKVWKLPGRKKSLFLLWTSSSFLSIAISKR
jgi:hypothetical protein